MKQIKNANNYLNKISSDPNIISICTGCGNLECCDSFIDIIQLSNKLKVKRGRITRYIKSVGGNFDFEGLIQFIRLDDRKI